MDALSLSRRMTLYGPIKGIIRYLLVEEVSISTAVDMADMITTVRRATPITRKHEHPLHVQHISAASTIAEIVSLYK